jgi:hypothetical protein
MNAPQGGLRIRMAIGKKNMVRALGCVFISGRCRQTTYKTMLSTKDAGIPVSYNTKTPGVTRGY